MVVGEDHKLYYAKSCKRIPDYCMLSEFLCHYFLQLWGIPSPAVAAMNIDRALLPTGLSQTHRLHYFEHPCFASAHIEHCIEVTDALKFDNALVRKIVNLSDVLKLALFDIWIENDDRKPTNLNMLLAPAAGNNFTLVAIDHSFTFSTMSYDQLDPEYIGSSFNDSILLSEIGQSAITNVNVNQAWIDNARSNFYLCIQSCRDNINNIAAAILGQFGFTPDLQAHIQRFLISDERNEKVFEEFLSRLY